METKEIHNQQEYDENKDFDGILVIKSGAIEVSDNATVRASGIATVLASGNATVQASGNATVQAWGNATVHASGIATVHAWDNATVRASGIATVHAWDNATVHASDNATVRASDNATVHASDNATVQAWGNATVQAWGNATVLSYNNNKIFLLQNATSKPYMDVSCDHALLEALAERGGDDLVLYKCVRDDYTDHRTGTLVYKIGGETIAPDWNPDPSIECGNGLHLCLTALETRNFAGSGPVLKCLVRPEDVAVYPGNIDKVRCRAVRPVAEVDLAGRIIEKKE